eukprot:1037877-Pleurochrysis_carterae.AAC.1
MEYFQNAISSRPDFKCEKPLPRYSPFVAQPTTHTTSHSRAPRKTTHSELCSRPLYLLLLPYAALRQARPILVSERQDFRTMLPRLCFIMP